MLNGRLIKIIIFCLILILTALWFMQSNYNSSVNDKLSIRQRIHKNIDIHFKKYNETKEKFLEPALPPPQKIMSSTIKVAVPTTKSVTTKTIKKPDYQFYSVAQAEEFYFKTITKDTFTCTNSKRFGRSDDGGWDLCLMDKLIPQAGKCKVYSFGVNYIWEFDDELSTRYSCTVRTFDPSMTNEQNEFQRASKVWFYKLGLGKESVVWLNGWRINSMLTILKKFNDQNSIIDVLKIDIEFSEWDSFSSMLDDGLFNNVKQLLFETHTEEVQNRKTSTESYIRFLKIWNGIYNVGFRQWKHHWNHFGNFQSPSGVQRTCCYEHYMININFL